MPQLPGKRSVLYLMLGYRKMGHLGGEKMKLTYIAIFIWLGIYGHLAIYIKQKVFQGQSVQTDPLKYATNLPFLISVLFLLGLGLSSWIFDALLRQNYQLSEINAYRTMIVTPISFIARLFFLWLSEQTLGDKINWNSAIIWIIGIIIATFGAKGLIDK